MLIAPSALPASYNIPTCSEGEYLYYPPSPKPRHWLDIQWGQPPSCRPITKDMQAEHDTCIKTKDLEACRNAYTRIKSSERTQSRLYKVYFEALKNSCLKKNNSEACEKAWQIGVEQLNAPFPELDFEGISRLNPIKAHGCKLVATKKGPEPGNPGIHCFRSSFLLNDRLMLDSALKSCKSVGTKEEHLFDVRKCMKAYEVLSIDHPQKAAKIYRDKFLTAEKACGNKGQQCQWLAVSLSDQDLNEAQWKNMCDRAPRGHPLRKVYCLLATKQNLSRTSLVEAEQAKRRSEYEAQVAAAEAARPKVEPKTCPEEHYLGHPPLTLPLKPGQRILQRGPRSCLPFTEEMKADRISCLEKQDLLGCTHAFAVEPLSKSQKSTIQKNYLMALKKDCQETKNGHSCLQLWLIGVIPTVRTPYWLKDVETIKTIRAITQAACPTGEDANSPYQPVYCRGEDGFTIHRHTFAGRLKDCDLFDTDGTCLPRPKYTPHPLVGQCDSSIYAHSCFKVFELLSIDKPEEATKFYAEKFAHAEKLCRESEAPKSHHCKWLGSVLSRDSGISWKSVCEKAHKDHPLHSLYCLLGSKGL